MATGLGFFDNKNTSAKLESLVEQKQALTKDFTGFLSQTVSHATMFAKGNTKNSEVTKDVAMAASKYVKEYAPKEREAAEKTVEADKGNTATLS